MNELFCICCRNPKAPLQCGFCKEALCKACAQFNDGSEFSFMRVLPEELSHAQYCLYCHSSKILAAKANYRQLMKKAESIYFIDKPRRKPLPVLKTSKEILTIEGCRDREETILRLAFHAAEMGFNAVVKAKVSATKIRNAGYQKMSWSGSGFPALLDSEKIEAQSL